MFCGVLFYAAYNTAWRWTISIELFFVRSLFSGVFGASFVPLKPNDITGKVPLTNKGVRAIFIHNFLSLLAGVKRLIGPKLLGGDALSAQQCDIINQKVRGETVNIWPLNPLYLAHTKAELQASIGPAKRCCTAYRHKGLPNDSTAGWGASMKAVFRIMAQTIQNLICYKNEIKIKEQVSYNLIV